MSHLLIYKASAGSGKTFALASRYIALLIKNPQAYKGILAVTFTNKATGEMKDRILQQLYGLWKGDPASAAYLRQIRQFLPRNFLSSQPELGGRMDAADVDLFIRRRAGEALLRLLHDYSRFQVTTIDSFFQSVLRNIARELGLSPNLNIELDTSLALDESVDSMIGKLSPSSPALQPLMDYIYEEIEKDHQWNVARSVKRFSNHLTREDYMEQGDDLRKQLSNPNCINLYRQQLARVQEEALTELEAFSGRFNQILLMANVSIDIFNRKQKGIAGYFLKLGMRKYRVEDTMPNTVAKALQSPEYWLTKSVIMKNPVLLNWVANQLIPLLQEAEACRKKVKRVINSCQLSIRHLSKLRLLGYVSEEMDLLNQHLNRFLLANTNDLLRRLVKSSDASFVFEKAGSEIRNVMIDEFQDTSRMQWKNFQTLLLEGLAQGADSLIVGDVKQAIYRWRNGDWGILESLTRNDQKQPFNIEVITLENNFRSQTHVVEFNNQLFTTLTSLLDRTLQDEERQSGPDNLITESRRALKNAYSDVCQHPAASDIGGYVRATIVRQTSRQAFVDAVMPSLEGAIQELISQGVKPSDMAILVRQNDLIPPLADLIDRVLQLPVVSDEAFRLDASPAVCLLIDALRYLSDDDHRLARASMALAYWQMTHPEDELPGDDLFTHPESFLPPRFDQEAERLQLLPLQGLLEELVDLFGLHAIRGQEAYLLAFFDAVSDYLTEEPSDLLAFVEHWEQTLCRQTIAGGESEGIRILSIHKAKGLEFHTVLVPFCNWTLEPKRENLVWCHPQTEPFSDLSLVPVAYSNAMAESIYDGDYRHERLQYWVDNLNLLYVALTRASHNLLLWGYVKMDEKGERDRSLSVGSLLQDALPHLHQDDARWDGMKEVYSCGSPCPSAEPKANVTTENRLLQKPDTVEVGLERIQRRLEFRQSNRSARFIAEQEHEPTNPPTGNAFIQRGLLLHELFAHIATLDDVEPTIRQFVAQGLITDADEEHNIRTLTRRAFARPEVVDWYNGSWMLHRESSIVWNQGGEVCNRRPDRVMTRGGETLVIDFKFGRPHPSYDEQVREYLRLLIRMGCNPGHIRGFLWYVELDRIDEVKLNDHDG